MPVVTLRFDRLEKILARKISTEKIVSSLPFLGLDIEEQSKDNVSVEYSPNRPDFSTDYGIATALEGLLGIKVGMSKLKIKKGKDLIKVDSSVSTVRPFVTAIEARNRKLDDETIRQIIAMQEDLHNGIGRKRKKASIGIHDLDKIKFPLVYATVKRTHKFIPLDSHEEMTINDILSKTETGIAYRNLLDKHDKVPIIVDSTGNTISFPPIINSKLTEVTTTTKNLLVEVTATDKNTAEDTLAVVTNVLQKARFDLISIRITGKGNSTPSFATKNMLLDPSLVNETLGLGLSISQMVKSLKKCRLGACVKGKRIACIIPRYRTDILSSIDLAEEVALGYGIQNFEPNIPPSTSAGQKNHVTILLDAARSVMVGLGYLEVINFGLGGKHVQYELTNRNGLGMISVVDSKSQEHSLLRDMLVPGLIDILSRNIHESYPQRIFEVGTVFHKDNPIKEETSLACLSAHSDASFTEIKSILQSVLKTSFNLTCTTIMSEDPVFEKGKTADIIIDGQKVGVMGEITSQVRDNFKLRTPIAGFEIKLTGLIFD